MTEASDQTTQTEETPQLPSFDEMPLSDDVKEALAEMGYTQPAAVQHAVYDPAVRGQDVVVQARTGTGKTAAFGIPLVDQMIKRSEKVPQALILTPTRELALQVAREIERIGAKRGIVPVSVYGGAPMQRQIDALRAGAQIIVGTPGRVLDHMRRGTLDPNELRILILDESDEMLSMGFERELNAIVDFMPEQKQTLLFSATLPPEIVRMASTKLHDPQFIYLSGDHIGALEILHFVYFVMQDKGDTLVRMLEVEDPESALIFCNTKDETERVASMLQRAGYDADWLNGDLPQSEREKVMTRSKEGKLRFLVATDVAARGIDISHLTHVINNDFPASTEVYVHRTGRTGRMGRTGTAISLITPQDIGGLYYLRLIYKIRPFEKQLPTDGDLKTRAQTDIISMLAEAFASEEPHPEDVALARRMLTHDRCEQILAGLLRNHLGDRMKSEDAAGESRRGRRPRPAPQEKKRSDSPPPRAPQPERTRGRRAQPAPIEPPERPARRRRERAESPPREEAPKVEETVAAAPEKAPSKPRAPKPASDPAPEAVFNEEKPTADFSPSDVVEMPDLDLPGYEMTPMTDEDLALVRAETEKQAPQAPQAPQGHAALADWSPPSEDNDDQPIFDDQEQDDEPDELEVFVNIGRKDGVRPGDFVSVLADAPGVSREDIGRIRIRDKHTFVAVRSDAVDAVIKALTGRDFGDRVVNAERARAREE
jgi:ATP-dependent RNA helicase DeaD